MGSPRIRLAYLVSQYPTVNHTYILREIRGLRELGWDVPVASIRSPDRPLDQLTPIEQEETRSTFYVLGILGAGAAAIIGAHVAILLRHPFKYLSAIVYSIRLAGANFRTALSNLLYFAEAVVTSRHFERLGVTHVHTHYSSTVALLLSRVSSIPTSASIHGPAEFENTAGFSLAEKVANAKFIRAISYFGASQLMRVSPREHWPKLEVVRLGVDTEVFAPRRTDTPGQRTELLSVGNLAAPKGQIILVAALRRLIQEGRTQIHLRLVGDGPLRPHLEKMIAEHNVAGYVSLEGACNQDRVLEFYRQADVFVLPSFAEGVPVVLMEAMAMELPCVATWITGVPELIRHDIEGWLIPPGNEQELSSAIGALMDDANLRQRLGRAARLRVKERHELSRNIAALSEVYTRRLGG